VGQHRFELLVLASLLVAGLLVSETVDHGTSSSGNLTGNVSALEPADFSIELHRGQVLLRGFTASAKHEQALAKIIEEEFGASEATLRYRPGIALSDDWVPATTYLLAALAATESASATVTEQRIKIRGVSSTPDLLSERLNALRRVLPEQMAIDHDVIIVDDLAPLSALCARAFARSLDVAVDFRQSSADIQSIFANLVPISARLPTLLSTELSRSPTIAVVAPLQSGGIATHRAMRPGISN